MAGDVIEVRVAGENDLDVLQLISEFLDVGLKLAVKSVQVLG